ELGETQPEEFMDGWIGLMGQIFAGEFGHRAVVVALAVGMDLIAALVAAEVAIEERAGVVELVEERDELAVEVLIEEARQAEGHEVEKLVAADKIALQLIGDVAPRPREGAAAETQRCDACLQPVRPGLARLHGPDQEARDIDVLQVRGSGGHVLEQLLDMAAEI